ANKESEAVGFPLCSRGCAFYIKNFENVKKENSSWSKTVAVMTDKDFDAREAFTDGFPQATL
ncbi:hypothetical protein J6590_087449, partial [Homalodisca vitripennis]